MHATLCDLMMDLVQNSTEADASEIELTIIETKEQIEFTIKDNGKGMSKETQTKAIDPFYSDGEKHAHRRVGLGLPFLLQTAEAADGLATIESEEGHGTQVHFYAKAQHMDLPPFGHFASTATLMLSQPTQGNLSIVRKTETDDYSVTREELVETLGDLNDSQNLTLIKAYIESMEENLEKAG